MASAIKRWEEVLKIPGSTGINVLKYYRKAMLEISMAPFLKRFIFVVGIILKIKFILRKWYIMTIPKKIHAGAYTYIWSYYLGNAVYLLRLDKIYSVSIIIFFKQCLQDIHPKNKPCCSFTSHLKKIFNRINFSTSLRNNPWPFHSLLCHHFF